MEKKWWRRKAEPEPPGPWTVVYAVRKRVGSHYEQCWCWSGGWQTPKREDAIAMAQRLQDDLAKRGETEPAWAYALVEDAQELSKAVPSPRVVQWPAKRWAEM